MARVLRPGGCLVLTDLDTHRETWMREEMADRWLGFEREDVARWFSAADLVDVRVECAEGQCCGDSPGREGVSLSIFVAYGVKGD
jgi:hypothetical protein